MASSFRERHLERLLRRRPVSWVIWAWVVAGLCSGFALLDTLRRTGELSWIAALLVVLSLMMIRYAYDQVRMFDLATRAPDRETPEPSEAEDSWGRRHVRRVLRNRPTDRSIWALVAVGVLLLAWSALRFREGIVAAAPPGMAGTLCLLAARYRFEVQLYGDRLRQLDAQRT